MSTIMGARLPRYIANDDTAIGSAVANANDYSWYDT
jgi:hypothetical protein